MSNMVSYTMISSDDDVNQGVAPGVFLLSELHPFDRMKVVLEQAIYLDYLQKCSVTSTLDEYRQNVVSLFNQLPNALYEDDVIRQDLYKTGYAAAHHILFRDPVDLLHHTGITAFDIYNIFNQLDAREYFGNRYTASMTKPFLDQWLASTCGWYNAEEFKDGITTKCAVYLPELCVCSIKENINAYISNDVCIVLMPVRMNSFDLKTANTRNRNCLSCYLRNFDMSHLGLDDLIGIYASFAIDHDRYVMTNSNASVKVTMADICFDMITGSSYVLHNTPAGKDRIVDLPYWKELVLSHVKEKKLKPVQDSKLFGELLRNIGESDDIVSYFTKDIDHITATEALSYRKSIYASLFTDKFKASMEDDADPATDDATATDETDTDNLSADLGGTDEMDDTSDTGDESDETTEKVKPQIDPQKMLLEISNPQNEALSDYMYRELVAQSISAIIKNPPNNARPNDILMLKRWRSRWLYLASVACLRDFLTRVSLRLSK